MINALVNTEVMIRSLDKAQQGDVRARLYLLADQSLRSVFHDPRFVEAWYRQGGEVKPILWQHPSLRADHRPTIFALDPFRGLDSELLSISVDMAVEDAQADSLKNGNGQRISGWFISTSPLSVLQVHLGNLAVQSLPFENQVELGRRRLLRYFDPMVFTVVWTLSDESQRATLLGPISCWHWLDRKASDNILAIQTALRSEKTPPLPSFHCAAIWTAQQWRTLLAVDAFHPVLISRGLRGTDRSQGPAVLACLARLRQQGVSHPTDLRHMVELALSRHPSFDLHSEITILIKDRGNQHAARALSVLAPQDWDRIISEIQQL